MSTLKQILAAAPSEYKLTTALRNITNALEDTVAELKRATTYIYSVDCAALRTLTAKAESNILALQGVAEAYSTLADLKDLLPKPTGPTKEELAEAAAAEEAANLPY